MVARSGRRADLLGDNNAWFRNEELCNECRIRSLSRGLKLSYKRTSYPGRATRVNPWKYIRMIIIRPR